MRTSTIMLAAGVFLIGTISAQDPQQAPEGTEGPPGPLSKDWEVRLQPSTTFIIGGDLDGASEGIDAWSKRVGIEASGPAWPGAWVTFGASYEHRHYDVSGSNAMLPGTNEPFEDVNTLALQATIMQGLSRTWATLFQFSVSSSAEPGADHGDAVSWNLLAGIGHEFSTSFRAGVGVALLSRFERDLLVIPGVQFQWRVSDDLLIKAEGPGLEIQWDVDQSWQLSLGGRFESTRFRLDSGAPGFGGIIADRRIPIFLRAEYTPSPAVDLALTVGVDVYREFQVEDAVGGSRRSFGSDPAPFFGFSSTIRF